MPRLRLCWGLPLSQKLRVVDSRSSLMPTILGVVVLNVPQITSLVSLFLIPNSMPDQEIGQIISQ